MSGVLYEIFTALQHGAAFVRELHINPLVVAITAGLIAAFMEQRRAARRAPPFTGEHTGAHAGKPR